jgi:hypothetical protein
VLCRSGAWQLGLKRVCLTNNLRTPSKDVTSSEHRTIKIGSLTGDRVTSTACIRTAATKLALSAGRTRPEPSLNFAIGETAHLSAVVGHEGEIALKLVCDRLSKHIVRNPYYLTCSGVPSRRQSKKHCMCFRMKFGSEVSEGACTM